MSWRQAMLPQRVLETAATNRFSRVHASTRNCGE
jgi:hypothetical protein